VIPVPSTEVYRVLIFDDDKDLCEIARNLILAIAAPGRIHVDVAYTASVAVSSVQKTLYDLILLDLYRQRELVGNEVFRKLNEMGCSTEVILITRFDLDPTAKPLIRAVAAQGSLHVVAFLDKRENLHTSIREEVKKRFTRFQASHFTAINLELAGRIIDRRRGRYGRSGVFPLRASVSEINTEVERLLRALYVEVPRTPGRSTDVTVTLEPIERRGLSAAVVVNATVTIGVEGLRGINSGHKTVLKIGPKLDILEEASRYREWVRYGVALDQRVELFGSAARDSLGALVYSFAGGLHGKRLASLDDLLIEDITAGDALLSREVIRNLFASRNWYSVTAPDVAVEEYFKENYHTDLLTSCTAGESAMKGLSEELDGSIGVDSVPAVGREEPHIKFIKRGLAPLKLPASFVLGRGSMQWPTTACLVHGDMHAGNVMVEISDNEDATDGNIQRSSANVERVCLIDFRNAGPGPRTADAVALESSIRLADSEAACREFSMSGELGLQPEDRIAVAEQMMQRVDQEMRLYRAIFEGVGKVPDPTWCALSADVLTGLRDCFGDVRLDEYLRTSIGYTLRQLGFKMHPVARVRVLAWLSAQYQLLP
jgi:CheY-like chemotaxis protein